jgi:beta-fructofuranosidase
MSAIIETLCHFVVAHPSTRLHVWLKATGAARPAHLLLKTDSGTRTLATTETTADFAFHDVALLCSGPAELAWNGNDTLVSCAYVFDPVTVAADGIRPIYIAEPARQPARPDSYHFTSPFGWMNDPNGFCRQGDMFHLFYQHYPHSLHWGPMHWGHAVSRDLVSWVHMPVALIPGAPTRDGAPLGYAFSGSARPSPSGDALHLFFTDHDDSRTPREFQRATVMSDGMRPDAAHVILADRPEGLGLLDDFRDPFVFDGPAGGLRMVVGGRDENGGVVLLYRSEQSDGLDGWELIGPIYRDGRDGTSMIECPSLVPLPGGPQGRAVRWALIYAQMDSRDPETGLCNRSKAVIGTFDGSTFRSEFEQDLDFAAGSYAFQAFATKGEVLAIGWLAAWQDWDRSSGFPSTMTLPRNLVLSDDGGCLLTPPISALTHLRRAELDATPLSAGGSMRIPDGRLEIDLTLAEPGNALRLDIAHETRAIALIQSVEGLELIDDAERNGTRRIAQAARALRIRVFVDIGSVEIFADDGRWAATRRIETTRFFDTVSLCVDAGGVAELRAWELAMPDARMDHAIEMERAEV